VRRHVVIVTARRKAADDGPAAATGARDLDATVNERGESMTSDRCRTEPLLQRLTRDAIDHKIDTLTRQLAQGSKGDRATAVSEARPRWITAAELVRRVRPFIVLN
jgi:hypothetical protein